MNVFRRFFMLIPRPWWWLLWIVAVILLGVASWWFESYLIERMFWVLLAVFTLIYAYSTKRLADEAVEQRLGSCKPLLVPVGGKDGVPMIVEPRRHIGNATEQWLQVHNIGLGPALNIAIRLEWRSGSARLDEQLVAEPLPVNGKGLVRQLTSAEKPSEIYDDHLIVISYDDLFGRRFETEGRYLKESDIWVSIKTKPAKNTTHV